MSEEQYVTRAEFQAHRAEVQVLTSTVAANGARLDSCESDRRELRSQVSTVAADQTVMKADQAAMKIDLAEVKSETKLQTASLQRIETALVPLAKELTGLIANPKVRALAYALAFAVTGALTAWIGTHK